MSQVQQFESNVPDRTVRRRNVFRGLFVAGLVGFGFAIGSLLGGTNPVVASEGGSTFIVKEEIQRPVIAIPKDGAAIIGASDDLYYMVKPDGSVLVLTGLRGEDLCWRRVDER